MTGHNAEKGLLYLKGRDGSKLIVVPDGKGSDYQAQMWQIQDAGTIILITTTERDPKDNRYRIGVFPGAIPSEEDPKREEFEAVVRAIAEQPQSFLRDALERKLDQYMRDEQQYARQMPHH